MPEQPGLSLAFYGVHYLGNPIYVPLSLLPALSLGTLVLRQKCLANKENVRSKILRRKKAAKFESNPVHVSML